MTQNDKELLIKDLCCRLPYGVKLGFYASATKQTYIYTLLGLEPQEDEPVIAKTENGSFYMLADNVKPYLFPISSMTEEQMFDFAIVQVENCKGTYPTLSECSAIIDWGYKHHFDVNGLIEKGLAIDATDKNIY